MVSGSGLAGSSCKQSQYELRSVQLCVILTICLTAISVLFRTHKKQDALLPNRSRCKPTSPGLRRRPDRISSPAPFCKLRTFRGDPSCGWQNDGRLPRTQRHRALHPVRDEYCKFGPAFLIHVCLVLMSFPSLLKARRVQTAFGWLCVFFSFLEVRLPNFTVMPA